MTMKHQNEELRVEVAQRQHECKALKADIAQMESLIIKYRQDSRLNESGLFNSGDQSLQAKVVEQRNQIKHLQGLLIRAK
jgi:hypothetical protein